jgi:hypothetical protein
MVELISPKKVLITHFGARMLRAPPEKEAERMTKVTGVNTIAAIDGMRIKISEAFKSMDLWTEN